MGFMRHIQTCNQHNPSRYIPFLINGKTVGRTRPDFSQLLKPWPEVFEVLPESLELLSGPGNLGSRSEAVAAVLKNLADKNILVTLHGENYGVDDTSGSETLLIIDRAMAPYFGVPTYGQHINGYVRTSDGLKLWIARRASDRINFPGCLDNFVAGGLPHCLGLNENIVKECQEEASVPEEIARQSRPVGAVWYHLDTDKGFNPLTLFCYDLEVPENFQPQCNDGEVEEFYLWPVEKVMDIVLKTDEFKPNCNLVILDFLVRHGYIGPENPQYQELLQGLHPSPPAVLFPRC